MAKNKRWDIIRRLLKERGWILQELIRRSGVTRTTFFNIQHGRSDGSTETWNRIARAFSVDLDVLTGDTELPGTVKLSNASTAVLPDAIRSVRIGRETYIRVPVVRGVDFDIPLDLQENLIGYHLLSTRTATTDDFLLEARGVCGPNPLCPLPIRKAADHVLVSRNVLVKAGDLVCVAFRDGQGGRVCFFHPCENGGWDFKTQSNKETIHIDNEEDFVMFGRIGYMVHRF